MDTNIRKIRFKMLRAKMSTFWREYRRSKAGIVGVLFVGIFVFFAAFGPYLAPYDPNQTMLATPLALPQWVTLVPGYGDLPPTLSYEVQWNDTGSDVFAFEYKPDSGLASLLKRENVSAYSVQYLGHSEKEVEFKMFFNFNYDYRPPNDFRVAFRYRVLNLSEMGYNLELVLAQNDIEGRREYSLWDSNFNPSSPQRSAEYSYVFDTPGLPVGFPKYVNIGSEQISGKRLGFSQSDVFLKEAFSTKGNYVLEFTIRLDPDTKISTCEVQVTDFYLLVSGSVFGLLGTDNRGRDIFSQLLCGTRISFLVGVSVAVLSTGLGLVFGTISGYIGGFVDEALMRTVDFLMCLPALPLLLVVVEMFKRSLWITIFIVILLSWMTLARMIRSQVLSLREASFVEAAIVGGGTKFSNLRKHIIPNVLPLAFSSMILRVPYAIVLESTISFLGLGDPNLISWGRMMNEAMKGAALANDAWWWLFSPGVAIALVCISFVLVNQAFDRIVNPRLRTRVK
jgi:peptide/nickel transport system permease protein